MKSLEQKFFRKKLRELGIFGLEKRIRGDLITFYKSLEGGCSQVGVDLLCRVANDRRRRNYFKCHQSTLYWTLRKFSSWIGFSSHGTDCPRSS